MNYIKFFIYIIIVFASSLIVKTSVLASTLPVSNVLILIKSVTNGQVVTTNTDDNGNFGITVPEATGAYNVFISDESMIPIKMIAKNNSVSGRIVILTDGTTTKDSTPVPVKKTTTIKKSTSAKKTQSVSSSKK